MATTDSGTAATSLVPTALDLTDDAAAALQRAAFHAYGEALAWARDYVTLSAEDDGEPDMTRTAVAIAAYQRALQVINRLDDKLRNGEQAHIDWHPWLRAVVVLALDYHRTERPILRVGQYDHLVWLSGAMDDAGWPELDEDAAWQSVFEGEGKEQR